MELISKQERVDLLKNLLVDPECWISSEILRLAEEEDDQEVEVSGPVGISHSTPTAKNKTK